MNNAQHTPEIDHHTLKIIVGTIACSLPFLTWWLSPDSLPSLSAAYWAGPWPRNIFVGFLFAIGAFLLAYNGYSNVDMWLSKIAAFAAVGVAVFPCACPDFGAGNHAASMTHIHYGSAAVMFGILAYFCYGFLRRSWAKGWSEARLRGYIYAASGIVILAAMAGMVSDVATNDSFTRRFPHFTFWAETAGLIAFGVAWLTASRMLPVVTRKSERLPIG